MNNAELEAILKKARAPERSGDFFEVFPQQIVRQLKRAEGRSRRVERRWFPRLAWGLVATACILMAFAIGHWRGRVEIKTTAANDIMQNGKLIRETLAMFPNRVRAIVCDKNGFNLILSDQNDVPDSTPIYIRVCNGEQCASFVTFSGQEIAMAGREVTVLSDARGGVILTGNQFLWSSDEQVAMDKGLKIEAKDLSQL